MHPKMSTLKVPMTPLFFLLQHPFPTLKMGMIAKKHRKIVFSESLYVLTLMIGHV